MRRNTSPRLTDAEGLAKLAAFSTFSFQKGLLMLGVNLFSHAIGMLLRNRDAALRIGGLMLVLQLLSLLLLGRYYFETITVSGTDMSIDSLVAMQSGYMRSGLVNVALVVVGLWTICAWHRFVLLNEGPNGYLPRWNGAAIWRYVKAGVVVALCVIAVALVGGLVFGGIAAALGMRTGFGAFLLMAPVWVAVILTVYRLAPMLPSAALGERLTVKQAFASTAGQTAALLVLALLSFVAASVLQFPARFLAMAWVPLGLVWAALAQWISGMVGASILTTLYGYFVEHRQLDA